MYFEGLRPPPWPPFWEILLSAGRFSVAYLFEVMSVLARPCWSPLFERWAALATHNVIIGSALTFMGALSIATGPRTVRVGPAGDGARDHAEGLSWAGYVGAESSASLDAEWSFKVFGRRPQSA